MQSPDNPTPYATTMLLGGGGGPSSTDSCTKHSSSGLLDGCSSGTASPPNQHHQHQHHQHQPAAAAYKPLLPPQSYAPYALGEYDFILSIGAFYVATTQRSLLSTTERYTIITYLCLSVHTVPANWTEFLPPPPEHPPPIPTNAGGCASNKAAGPNVK